MGEKKPESSGGNKGGRISSWSEKKVIEGKRMKGTIDINIFLYWGI